MAMRAIIQHFRECEYPTSDLESVDESRKEG
jgi:hypothetical protein